jgi:hypothetical protein
MKIAQVVEETNDRKREAGGEERNAAWSVRLPPPHQYDKWLNLKGHRFARLESRS